MHYLLLHDIINLCIVLVRPHPWHKSSLYAYTGTIIGPDRKQYVREGPKKGGILQWSELIAYPCLLV